MQDESVGGIRGKHWAGGLGCAIQSEGKHGLERWRMDKTLCKNGATGQRVAGGRYKGSGVKCASEIQNTVLFHSIRCHASHPLFFLLWQ
jgi:hypothetical protein